MQADGGGTIAVDGTTPTTTSGFLIPGGQSIATFDCLRGW
jgi:hypothetical protein